MTGWRQGKISKKRSKIWQQLTQSEVLSLSTSRMPQSWVASLIDSSMRYEVSQLMDTCDNFQRSCITSKYDVENIEGNTLQTRSVNGEIEFWMLHELDEMPQYHLQVKQYILQVSLTLLLHITDCMVSRTEVIVKWMCTYKVGSPKNSFLSLTSFEPEARIQIYASSARVLGFQLWVSELTLHCPCSYRHMKELTQILCTTCLISLPVAENFCGWSCLPGSLL